MVVVTFGRIYSPARSTRLTRQDQIASHMPFPLSSRITPAKDHCDLPTYHPNEEKEKEKEEEGLVYEADGLLFHSIRLQVYLPSAVLGTCYVREPNKHIFAAEDYV